MSSCSASVAGSRSSNWGFEMLLACLCIDFTRGADFCDFLAALRRLSLANAHLPFGMPLPLKSPLHPSSLLLLLSPLECRDFSRPMEWNSAPTPASANTAATDFLAIVGSRALADRIDSNSNLHARLDAVVRADPSDVGEKRTRSYSDRDFPHPSSFV